MGFQKGMPRPPNAGRKKGSKNKVRVFKVAEILAEKGIHPIEKILDLLPQLEPKDAVKTWLELQSYCQIRPKADAPEDSESDNDLLEKFENVTDETLLKIVSTDEAM